MVKSNAHIAEERMKSESGFVKDYIQESIRNLQFCHFCKKELQGMAYKCKFCLHNFCSEHKTPQAHRCPVYHSRLGAEARASRPDPREHTDVYHAAAKIRKPMSFKPVLIIISLAILIVSFFVAFSNYEFNFSTSNETVENTTNYTTQTIVVTEPVTKLVPAVISYKDYILNITYYDGSDAALIGFLTYELEGDDRGGQYVEKIMDDFGDRIILVDLEPKHKALFTLGETTKDLYKVDGTFQRRYKTAQFKVKSIEKTERPNMTIEVNETYEKTVVVELTE